eukprot:SAG31_NODE_948_length_10825_cov_9.412829_1_plen_20_part_10
MGGASILVDIARAAEIVLAR